MIKLTPILDSLKLEKIDDSIYFSEKYSGYISNSRLSLIDPSKEGTPEKFFQGLGKNKIYSDSLIFGSAIHELFLQPELFELVNTVDRSTAKLGFMHDYLYKYYLNDNLTSKEVILASDEINYYKNKMDSKKIDYVLSTGQTYWSSRKQFEVNYKGNKELIYLDPKSRTRLIECLNSLNNNKQIQNLIHPTGLLETPISENEQAILLDIKVEMPECDPFIFRMKAKLDNYTIDKELNEICINDVKTLGKILSDFTVNFNNYSYYRELALYSWLLSLVAKKYYNLNNPKITSNCLVVSTIPAYYSKIYKVTKADFNKGWNEFVYLFKLAAQYYSQGYRFE